MEQASEHTLPRRGQSYKLSIDNDDIDTTTHEVDETKAAAKLDLETLAVELKLGLLNTLCSLSDLQSLVHASPAYHRVFQTDWHGIVTRVLLNELDARWLQHVLNIGKALDIRQECAETKEDVEKFLESSETIYAEPARELQKVVLRHGLKLAQIQCSVQSAIRDFCISVLPTHPITGEPFQENATLSPTEQARISRAFYRFETFCIVFREPYDYEYMHFNATEQSFLFLHMFSPWEVEEIVCVRDYIRRTYTNLYETHAAALSKRSSSKRYAGFLRKVIEPDDNFLDQYIERCMSRGLPYLQTILQASPSQQELMFRDNIQEMCPFLTEALEENNYDFSYRTQPYVDWVNQTEQRFKTDTVDEPNAAWSWSTGNKCEIMYGEKPDLSKWGYVFWDKERLDRWGILEQDNTPYVRKSYD